MKTHRDLGFNLLKKYL